MRGSGRQYLVFSILLMMVCVQAFTMHFHFPGAGDDRHPHAHAHVLDGMDAGHLGAGHDDEATSDLSGVIAKQTLSIDSLVFILLALVAAARAKLCIDKGISKERPHYYLLFYRPPLRAPPL